MSYALLIAATLCTGPAFWVVDTDAPSCPPERQLERCTCGEYLLWAESPGAVSYEVERCLAATKYREFDDARNCHISGTTTENHWYFTDDEPLFPKMEHATWRYRVRAVGVDGERSEWVGPVFYRRNPWPMR